MIALAFLLGASVLALSATTVTFAVLSRRDANHLASIQIAQAHSEGEQTRLAYELDQTNKALADAKRRAAALEGVLADDVPTSRDLSSADWRQRLLRITQAWGNAHDPAADDVVPDKAAPAAPGAGSGEVF